ncbi:hypothetical protein [Methanobrevibacter sp.]
MVVLLPVIGTVFVSFPLMYSVAFPVASSGNSRIMLLSLSVVIFAV